MKPPFSFLARLALLAAFTFAPLGLVRAQQVTILHSFGDGSVTQDGSNPESSLILAPNGDFYGVTTHGGASSDGCIFQMSPSGVITILHSFANTTDGYNPSGLLLGFDGNLYGMATGGRAREGLVFSITPQGTFYVVHNFGDGSVPNDGTNPAGTLIQGSDGSLYGVTSGGGLHNDGTVFNITTSGLVTILHSFGGTAVKPDGSVATDGSNPVAGLVQAADGYFYGTAGGGANGNGVVFQLKSTGTMTILHTFTDGTVANDGEYGDTSLVEGPDGNLYGTTESGGAYDAGFTGTVFKITPQGGVTILHSFGDQSVLSDGDNDTAVPQGGLVLGTDGYFYGTSTAGGSTPGGQAAASGVLFKISPDGHYLILHDFTDGSVANDGATPRAALTRGPNGLLYGVTSVGGSANLGTVYTLAPTFPVLTSLATARGNVSLPFTYQVLASNNPTGFLATNLPDGLSIDTSKGLISGTPTTVQTKTVTLTITNASGSSTFSLPITIAALPAPVIASSLTAYGSVGTSFTYNIAASNNPISYAADAASLTALAAANLSFNTSTGVISGTPSSTGIVSVTLTASNAGGPGSSVSLSIQILAAPPTLAQVYSILHVFGSGTPTVDGHNPCYIIQGFDGNYYGVTKSGGANGAGAIFKMTESGTVSLLYSLPSSSVASSGFNGPENLVQAADGNFYGTTTSRHIFKLSPSGELTILHYLSADENAGTPNALIQGFDGNFYGTTASGSTYGGIVFKMTPQGSVTVLHTFGDGSVINDGFNSQAPLVQGSDGSFYGTTIDGGNNSAGIAFKITPQGIYSILHFFGGDAVDLHGATVPEGTNPSAALIQGSDGNFFGTTYTGSPNGGTVFKMSPLGDITILYSFGNTTRDGGNPATALLQGYDGNFYGTNSQGGSASAGTFFEVTPQGTETTLYNFGSTSGDGTPYAVNIIQSAAGNFYGVTANGGNGAGTIYTIQAMQTPTHVPIYTGAAYQEASVLAPFSFTPKALFGVSGSGNVQTNAVKAPSSGGMMDALVSLFVPQSIRKNYSLTSWSLFETGVGAIPPNTLQPLNLMFDPTSGTISGTPTQGGSFALTMTPSNVVGAGSAQPVTIYIDVPPDLSGAATASATVGTSFSYQVASTPPAISYNASNLPPGLSFDSTTNLVSGTPTTAGTYVFTTTAYNLAGENSKDIVLTVTGGSSSAPTITSSTVASGAVGTPFTYHITTAHAATALTALIPPCGLAFDASSGTITGTPNANGSFQIPITATNTSGMYASVLTLTVTPPAAPTIASTLTTLVANGVPLFYVIPANGVVSTYSEAGALPDGLTFNAATGTVTGTPTTNGNTTIHLTVGNGTGSANSVLTLKVQTPIDYGSWTTTYGVTGGALGMPYHDGVPNLLKYALDINPGHAATATDRAALPVVTTSGTGSAQVLTITYRENALAGDLAPVVQTCSDLRSWSAADDVTTTQIGSDPITGDPILQAQVPVTSGRQFIRLNVAQP